jgi:hypothetical protein
MSWDVRQLSQPGCISHFLLRFWPSAQFGISPKPLKVEVSLGDTDGQEGVVQVGEQQQYGGSLVVEQCRNYTWVLTAVAEGGKGRAVQGGPLLRAMWGFGRRNVKI